MAEYIERDALLEKVRELSNTYSYCGLASVHIIKAIEDAPKADAVEVKHGEWIEFEDDFLDTLYQCSVCKEDFVIIEGTPSENLWKYCPNCGAKMDKKEGAEE